MSSDFGGRAGAPVVFANLVEYFARHIRSAERVGIEHELLPVDPATGRAWPFAVGPTRGPDSPRPEGVEAAFLGLLEMDGYKAAQGQYQLTTLYRGEAAVNLEPGGQLEISGTPFDDLHGVAREARSMAADYATSAEARGFVLLSHGVQPVSTAAEIEMVPKRRYRYLSEHLRLHGGPRFRDMMVRTASVQASFDYTSEADAGLKLRLALLAAPVATALFANSPFEGGRPCGWLSSRGAVWRETDPARWGLIRAAVEGRFSFERLVAEMLEIPAVVVRARDGSVATAGGRTFADLLRHGLDDRQPTMADWALHLSTVFTDARLKNILEVRCCDAPPPDRAMAVPAFWTGLLYHRPSREAALELLSPGLTPSQPSPSGGGQGWGELGRARWYDLHEAACRDGLAAPFSPGQTMADLARELVELARQGLAARGRGEERYLVPAQEWADSAREPAREALGAFERGGIQAVVEAARVAGRGTRSSAVGDA